MKQEERKYIARNKKASFDYFILSTYEAGIVLFGTEIKSIRQGRVNLKDSYCEFKDGELYIRGMHISPYEQGNIFNRDPMRLKKLLLHKREIMSLFGKTKQDGLTLIPLSLYFSGSRVKVELGLCRGKKNYDKRDTIAKKEASREMEKRLKEQNR
ncbi:MAG: SsrA-binding protein SmpB [Clostridia bacterium]|nr:SsrA-binding protein SmpB [Clostridia bacterium]MBQ9952802.1 SsrA-binding protein SmpB [Clostridia bacterium]MBR2013070.1 SsrA-binding protein SmpB [Clostridia bacterium]MBR2013475.1 SsrA-binding protein SmpB [Clostridia bacterium]MBR4087396.1 SsrA-binding protein SmpB [Clostridia bacterium]